MKKYILDLTVTAVERPHERYVLLKLTDKNAPLPDMVPGQFAQIRVDGSPTTFLRRPISIHFVDVEKNEIWFLVQLVGDGTRQLGKLHVGDQLNVVFPLGNGFTLPIVPCTPSSAERILLVGGGVGAAPLLYAGAWLSKLGYRPTFLIGARSKGDLLQLPLFEQYGEVYVTTEDASYGEKGFVTQHSLLQREKFTRIATCGPKPMMVSVARYARQVGIPCEVSLENKMACGVGACLCCVEDTAEHGHVCVCTEGPVFNINDLKWQI